jgi:CRP/FNR family transcriptional regulator, cyclic AMP receptor protein
MLATWILRQATAGRDRMTTNILDKCAGLPEVHLPAGTILLNEGEKSGKLYILIDGEFEVSHGGVQIANISTAGSVFGEMSILLDAPHTASVKALRPSRAFLVDDVGKFLQAAPQVMHHIAALLALRLQLVTGYLADLKRQYAEHSNHLGMVDEVLGTLLHQQRQETIAGPSQGSDPRL